MRAKEFHEGLQSKVRYGLKNHTVQSAARSSTAPRHSLFKWASNRDSGGGSLANAVFP